MIFMKKDSTKIKKIIIKAKKAVFSEMVGNNSSMFLGEGYDFAELREYQIGDDIRHIDWIITAKAQKPFVKIFHAQKELNVVCALLLGGSVYFGTTCQIQEIIAEITSIIGFSAIKNGDPFSYYIFANKLYDYHKPSKNLFSIQDAISKILEFDPLNKMVDYSFVIKFLFEKIKRKSLIFIIGDFVNVNFDFKVLAKKHEIVAIVVRDRLQEEPKAFGAIEMVDPENGVRVSGYISQSVVNDYIKKMKIHDIKLFEHFKESKIKFQKVYTDDEPFAKLIKLFGKK